MADEQIPPGWYPDREMVNTQRFWDGEKWTDQTMPLPPAPTRGFSAWKGITVVALGILCAVATITVIYNASQPSDTECAIQQADLVLGEIEPYEVDPACRE